MLKGIGKLAIITYVAVLILLRVFLPTVANLEYNSSMEWYRRIYIHAAGMGRDYLRTLPSPEWVHSHSILVHAKRPQFPPGIQSLRFPYPHLTNGEISSGAHIAAGSNYNSNDS